VIVVVSQANRSPRERPAGGASPGSAARGVFANAATSCPFAMNVEAGYWNSPVPSYEVYSPVTGQDYAMTSAGWNPDIVTGGNGALVQFTAG
jgi:hypothetical protein